MTNNSNAPRANIHVVSYRIFGNTRNKSTISITETVICTTSGKTVVLRTSLNDSTKLCNSSARCIVCGSLRACTVRCFVLRTSYSIVGKNVLVFSTNGSTRNISYCPTTRTRLVSITTVNPSCLPTACAGCNPKIGVYTPNKSNCLGGTSCSPVVLSAVPARLARRKCKCVRNASVTYPRISNITTLNLSCIGGLNGHIGHSRFIDLLLTSIGSVRIRVSEAGTNLSVCSCRNNVKAKLIST